MEPALYGHHVGKLHVQPPPVNSPPRPQSSGITTQPALLRRIRRGWWHVGTSRTLVTNVGMQCGACALCTSRRQAACSTSSSELAPAPSIKWHHDTAGTAAPLPPRLVARWHIAYAPDQRRNAMWSLRSMDITSASCCSHSSSELAPAHSIKWHQVTAGTAAPPPPRLLAR